jgi:hypothetical protein
MLPRFPEDVMLQLTRDEAESTRSQFAILKTGRSSNLKYAPYVFTDYGAIQASMC